MIDRFVATEEGVRLDVFLSEKTGKTRSAVAKAIEEGNVRVNGKMPTKAGVKVACGDEIVVDISDPRPISAEPQDIPIEILYEDADIVVVNKPQGMVTHPAAGSPDGTLVNALLARVSDLSGINGEIRPGIVHRLDKDTSGVLVIAKNDAAHLSLSKQISDKTALRYYYALVVGKIAAIEGFNWNNDIPMNLASDGKWYSVPVALAEDDEIKIRYMAAWDDDRGGDVVAVDEAFAVAKGGHNIKAPKAGTYMVVYDPKAETITLSTDFWGLIGEFNGWNGDRFLLPAGDGKWSAFNQEISGGWKIRKGADWAVSAGGTYVAAGEPFDAVTDNGANIAVGDLTRFDVVYDTAAGKITVSKPVK